MNVWTIRKKEPRNDYVLNVLGCRDILFYRIDCLKSTDIKCQGAAPYHIVMTHNQNFFSVHSIKMLSASVPSLWCLFRWMYGMKEWLYVSYCSALSQTIVHSSKCYCCLCSVVIHHLQNVQRNFSIGCSIIIFDL